MICRFLLVSFVALLIVPTVAPSKANAQQSSGPEVGITIDEFSLQDQHGTSQNLSDLLTDGPVALIVFRSADW